VLSQFYIDLFNAGVHVNTFFMPIANDRDITYKKLNSA